MKQFFKTIITVTMALFAFPVSGCGKPGAVGSNLDFRLYTGGESYYVAGIGKETSSDIVVPAVYNGKPVVGVGGKSFKDNKTVESVVIPSSVEWVGVGAFRNCPALKRVVWNAVSARTDENNYNNRVFLGSENIEEFIVGETVETIPGGLFAYSGGSKISEITLPSSVKKIAACTFSSVNRIKINVESLNKWLSVEKYGNGAPLASSYTLFAGGEEVETAVIDGVAGIHEYEFAGCASLKRAEIGEDVETIARTAFADCANLSAVTVSGNNPKFYESGGVVYSAADNALTVVPGAIGGEVTIPYGVPSVPRNAFASTLIEKLVIPGSVRVIGGSSFDNCKKLTSVTISDGVTGIDDWAFGGCPALETVILPKTVTSLGDELFGDSPLVSVYYLGETVPAGANWAKLPLWLYSETAPASAGNYWHYGADGVTPVKWENAGDDRVDLPPRPARRPKSPRR